MTTPVPDQKRVLAIFSHPDDELGCVGTLANHADNGDDVYLVFLTKGENSTTVAGDSLETISKRKHHTDRIAELLGIQIRMLDFPDSKIDYTVDNSYSVAEVIKEIRPHILITWNEFTSVGAGHPDHRNTSKIVYDAINYARYQSMDSKLEPWREPIHYYRYHNPRLNQNYELQFVDVSHQEEKILKFIEIYKEAYGSFPVEEFKFNSMRYYGYSLGVKLVEVFEVIQRNLDPPKVLP